MLSIIGLALLAGGLYMLQPTELKSVDAFVQSIKKTYPKEGNWLSEKWEFGLALTRLTVAPGGKIEWTIIKFEDPKINNWSSRNRKKLSFFPHQYTMHFNNDVMPELPGVRAKIYFLKNKWTRNQTRDDFIAHILTAK
ncbi:MAG: hypothetical protein V1661_00245 [bacterium]